MPQGSGTKPCSTCDRVLVYSEDPATSRFRVKLDKGSTYHAGQCLECEAEDKAWNFPSDRKMRKRVPAKPFQEWLLDFVANFDGTRAKGNDMSAATFLGIDQGQFRRTLTQDTVTVALIDATLLKSGKATNLWELLPPEERQYT